MSWKGAAVKQSEGHYVLPRTKDMNCDIHAFLNERLYNLSDEGTWAQAVQNAGHVGVTGVYLMPDCHKGYTIPVGGVVVTEDVIMQAGSGYDISCGVAYLKVKDLKAQDVASWDKRVKWIAEVEKRSALGIGHDRPELMPEFSRTQMNDMLLHGAKPLGVDADKCERQFIPIHGDHDIEMIDRAYSKARVQLGSVGGGNHFIEMQVDRDDGSVWVMIHCGSRGFGFQTAEHFFRKGAEALGLPSNRKEQSWVRADTPLGKEYWAFHNMAANYAIANRHVIVQGIQGALRKVFKVEAEMYYEISHNLVQHETLVLPDGTTKKGFVHRKGATRAFPAGHPDLMGTRWAETGHPCLIPGSMYHGAAILFPKEGAYRTACSVNHGSGRLMARGQAMRDLKHKQRFIDKEMRNVKRKLGGTIIKGIASNCRKTPLDECAHVYKDLDEVLSVLEAENVAEVKHRLFPVANLKGA